MHKPPPPSKTQVSAAPALHRSGAVARMLGMPVATLRVWQRRYALTPTARSPSGQRLYSADDVRRLAWLRHLTDQGHAIGSLASLDTVQLQAVAATHAQALAATQATQAGRPPPGAPAQAPSAAQPWRLVVVGKALGARLQRPALLRRLGRPVQLLGPFADVAQATTALAGQADGRPADAWLLHAPQLHAQLQAQLHAQRQLQLQAPWMAPEAAPTPAPVAVLFGYAADAVCEALAASGVALLREPQPDVALAQWLRQWADASAGPASALAAPAAFGKPVAADSASSSTAPAPRRWDEAALSDIAAMPTGVACECPRHLAELLMQLSRFEAYSAQCAHRSPVDAALHAHLGQVAARARVGLEGALAQVALQEGLHLPPSSA